MALKQLRLQLTAATLTCFIVSIAAFADVTVDAQTAFGLYNKKQYAAAAKLFEAIISKQPSARYCYYAALSNQGNRQETRARQLYQYVVSRFPASTEAAYAKKALAQPLMPVAGSSSTESTELPDSVKKLIPKDMQAMLNTPVGKQALAQMMKDKADELTTIRKAEAAGVLKQDQLAAAVESNGMMTAHTGLDKNQPFTPADIAKQGAGAIDQMVYGNCWFEASMASLAELPRGQKLLSSMIKLKDQDKYVVRFPGDGVEYVVTNQDLITSNIHDSGLWASLLECAMIRKYPENKGGHLDEGLGCITGCPAESLLPANASPQEISSFIGGAVTSKNPVLCATYSSLGGLPNILFPNHAYTVVGFDPARNMITLRNPHGIHAHHFSLESDPRHESFEQLDDGFCKVSIPIFQKYFQQAARSFI
jgi:Calpain family cysteine protease